MDFIKLTDEQKKIVKQMVRLSEAFANQLLHIMQNHGLDKIDGCDITIQVDPKYQYIARTIEVGSKDTDFGYAKFIRGIDNDYWKMWGKCSEEYESVFEDEAIRAGRFPDETAEKPLPPDGLWVGDCPDDCSVVGRMQEWDVNDSLS